MNMTSITTSSHTHTYRGAAEITFSVNNEGALSVTIDTQRLHIRSITELDAAAYFDLFRDQEVMQQYANGQIRTMEKILKNIERWLQWWQKNNPYSGLAIFRKDTQEFIGHALLEYGHIAGQVELSYLFLKNHWGQGFGAEAATALIREYAPATVGEGYLVKIVKIVEEKCLEQAAPLDLIIATTRLDNDASRRILEKIGMRAYMDEKKYEVLDGKKCELWRKRYCIFMKEIFQTH